MAINKVEYIKDSKFPNFAIAGDEKTITLSTAKTIDEDVQDGNTAKLTSRQQKYLNFNLSKIEETTTYETEPGDETLPPPEEGDESDPEKQALTDNIGGSTNVNGINPANAMFGTALLQSTAILTSIINPVTPTAPLGTAALAAGTLGVAGAAAFDMSFIERMSDMQDASALLTTVDEYSVLLDEDLKTMQNVIENVEEGAKSAEGTEDTTENNTQNIEEELATLKEQLEQAKAEGDEEKVAEITAQIEQLTASAQNNMKNSPEQIIVNNEIAHEMFETTTSVAEFLKDGAAFGTIGSVNTAALAGASALSFVFSGKATAISAYWATLAAAWETSIITASLAPIATVKSGEAAVTATYGAVAGGLFASASVIMAGKTAAEYVAGSKGDELKTSLKEFNETLTEHDKIVETLNAEKTNNEGEGPNNAGATGGDGNGAGDGTGGTGGAGGTGSAGGSSGSAGGSSGSAGGSSGGAGGTGSAGGSSSGSSGGAPVA